jgi:hypothetical protein
MMSPRAIVGCLAVGLCLTAAVADGAIPVGIPGQWTYGLYHESAPPQFRAIPPLYERLWLAFLTSAVLAAVAWAGSRRIGRAGRAERGGWMALLLTAGSAQLVGLIAVSRAGLAEPAMVHYCDWSSGYFSDALRVKNEPDVAARYAELIPRLSWHSRSHPPGPLMINRWTLSFFEAHPAPARGLHARALAAGVNLNAVRTLFERGKMPDQLTLPVPLDHEWAVCYVLPWIILAFGVSAAIPVYLLGSALKNPTAGYAAAALYLALPALAFFEPKMDLIYALFTAWTLYFLGRAFASSRGWAWGVGAGAAITMGLFFGYNQLGGLPLIGIWGLLELRRGGMGSLVKIALGAFAGFAAVWLLLRLSLGYDLVLDILGRRPWEVRDWPAWLKVDVSYRRPYGPWVAGNLIEFLTFVGFFPAIACGWNALRGARSWSSPAERFAAAVTAGILILDLSGVVRGEAGRLWMFLMPAVAVAAAPALSNRPRIAALAVATVWLQALLIKLTLTTNNIIN